MRTGDLQCWLWFGTRTFLRKRQVQDDVCKEHPEVVAFAAARSSAPTRAATPCSSSWRRLRRAHGCSQVIAHPGNEAMFFAPLITALLKTKSAGHGSFAAEKGPPRRLGPHLRRDSTSTFGAAWFVSALFPVLPF
jgi:hypothetical protein